MLSLSRYCRSASILPQIKHVVNSSSRNFVQSGAPRRYITPVFTRQTLCNRLKTTNFLRQSGTVAAQLTADVSHKGKKAVGYWLLTCSGMVFVAVILEGVTRKMGFGSSVVTCKFLSKKMPRTEAEWEEEFRKYQETFEFKNSNREMTLSQFKLIWYVEYSHRQWGRAIGACFLIPAVYFWARGRLTPGLKRRIPVFGALIATQDLIGWYSAKSGPQDGSHGEGDIPQASPYKLAGHVSLAYVLYTFLFWSTLFNLLPAQKISIASREAIKASRRFRMLAHLTKGLAFLTAVSGAFVAALDAGLVYNSFPKMADKWIPDDILALSPKLSNLTQNPTTVQFEHRVLGTFTLGVITGVWLLSRKRTLPPRAYKAAAALAVMGYLQVALGVTSLLTYVPTDLAISHQTGSLVLLSIAVWLAHELKRLPK